ncbi:uncharacterized protein LOC122036427 isoform X1 [Zingiber officinale]|uniref:Uncharacterized protein n=2 Tax=Zingiber officinale TaxID=94328 RepID=A0A8J5BUT2_ZINOF|nr:uncharacterized protein LOC122036427 isoform X1 [Zingiber officinale]KAG6466624.1 hypothetical protein ZIOFF_075561 [Zingiber officinale]
MGVLLELEKTLRSKSNGEKITPREELVLDACKSKSIRDFTVGFCASSAAVWAASRRLQQAQRFNLSISSAIFCGMWRFNNSLNVCVDQLLALEGSRIQRELANVILTKHANSPEKVKLVRKHYYPEQVFSDLNPDKTTFRWRLRNVYMDGTSHRTDSVEDNDNHDKQDLQPDQFSYQGAPGGDMIVDRYQGAPVGDMIVDPLDFIFGYPESNKEIKQSDNTVVPSKRRLRAYKRWLRRHQAHHESTDSNTS